MKTPNQSLKTYVRPGKTKASDDSLKCRMCLSRFTEMIDIFLVESEPLTNINIIDFCIGLEISKNDGLPSRMCTECYRNLMDFYAFKRMCLASDARLKTSRDAALKAAEILNAPIDLLREDDIKVEPQDELSLAETSDMVLLETDGFHPDAPDEVFSQITKFEMEEESIGQSWSLPVAPIAFMEEEDDATSMDEGGHCEEEDVPAEQSSFEATVDSTTLHETPVRNTPGPNTPSSDKNTLTSTTNKTFACLTCAKRFRSACSLRRHKLIHVGPRHSCSHCEKQFTQKDSLKRHMFTHMDRRFVCAECSKVLMSRDGLKCHLRTHHSDRSQTNNYYKYKCQECNKSFAHASGLSRHTAIHRGIKYECSSCLKKFNDSSQLKRHKRTHLKESDNSKEVTSKETDPGAANSYNKNNSSQEVSSTTTRLSTSPEVLECCVEERRETSDPKGLTDEQERKQNANDCNNDNVSSEVLRPDFQTTKANETSGQNKFLKVPYNNKFYGDEKPKYVILQAL